MMQKVNVVIADDSRIFCMAFRAILKEIPFIGDVYVAHNGEEALALLRSNPIQLLLLDIRMPVMDGLKTTEYILKNHSSSRVIVMTVYSTEATVLDMFRSGAHGILLKEKIDYSILETAILDVMNGRSYFCKEAQEIIAAGIKELREPSRTRFTPREVQVLRLTCNGSTAKEIANELKVSLGSIENFRKELLRKSKTRNVAELVAFAIRNGIV